MNALPKIFCSGHYISLQILVIALYLPIGNAGPVDPTALYLHRNIFDQQLSTTDPEIVEELKGLWVDVPRMTEELELLFRMASDVLADFEEEKISSGKKRQTDHKRIAKLDVSVSDHGPTMGQTQN